jgi:hypothetical protein
VSGRSHRFRALNIVVREVFALRDRRRERPF